MPKPLPIESDRGAPGGTERGGSVTTRWLFAGATLALLGAGLLLWSRDGEAVFASYVLAALAWCF